MVIERLLDRERHRARALVQNRVLRTKSARLHDAQAKETHLGAVVEQPCHRDTLLVASAESVAPFPRHVPPAFALDDVVNLQDRQDTKQVGVRHSACRSGQYCQKGDGAEKNSRSIIWARL